MSISSSSILRNGLPPLKLDLKSQRLLIGPDDPLPKFYPRPKAVMITPIYDDAEVSFTGPAVMPHAAYSSGPYVYPSASAPDVPSLGHHHEQERPPLGLGGRNSHNSETNHTSNHNHSHPIAEARHDKPQNQLQHGDRPNRPPRTPHSPTTPEASRPPLSPTRTSSGNHILQNIKARHEAFHEAVRNYFTLLPPHPAFCRSHCSGRKRAVCIGINYVGQRHELKGCANDARNMREFLIQQYQFPPTEILLLTDDDRNNPEPTRKEMFKAMAWLVDGAMKDDSLFFHYSGHGGQVKDEGGREIDGMDEDIFPVDAAETGDIIDDDLHKALVVPLPPGCRLTAIFDSCHSGTVLDLPYIHSAHGRLRSISHISKRARDRGIADSADVICFSACKDDETSADTFTGGVAVGAMSYAFTQALEQDRHQTYDELLARLREVLIPKYHQKAQISCTQPLELERQFTL